MTQNQRETVKAQIREILSKEPEVQRVVLFGSFVHSDQPNDLDIAVFQNSTQDYLPLAMKYRKLVRDLTNILPIDILPIKLDAQGTFLDEIASGEIIYEK